MLKNCSSTGNKISLIYGTTLHSYLKWKYCKMKNISWADWSQLVLSRNSFQLRVSVLCYVVWDRCFNSQSRCAVILQLLLLRAHPLFFLKSRKLQWATQCPSAPWTSAPTSATSAEELGRRSRSSVDWKAGEGERGTMPIGNLGGVRAEKNGMKMSLLYFSFRLANYNSVWQDEG